MKVRDILEAGEPADPSKRRFLRTAASAAASAAMPGSLVKTILTPPKPEFQYIGGINEEGDGELRVFKVEKNLVKSFMEEATRIETTITDLIEKNPRYSPYSSGKPFRWTFLVGEIPPSVKEELNKLKPVTEKEISDMMRINPKDIPDYDKFAHEYASEFEEVWYNYLYFLQDENVSSFIEGVEDYIFDYTPEGIEFTRVDWDLDDIEIDDTPADQSAEDVVKTAIRSSVPGQIGGLASGGSEFMRNLMDIVDKVDEPKTPQPGKPEDTAEPANKETPALPSPDEVDDPIAQLHRNLNKKPTADEIKIVKDQGKKNNENK